MINDSRKQRAKFYSTACYVVMIAFCIYSNYYTLLTRFLGFSSAMLTPVFVVLLLVLQLLSGRRLKICPAEIIWLALLAMLAVRSQEFANGSTIMTMRMVCYWLIAYILSQWDVFPQKVIKTYIVIGLPNILATIFFLFFPSVYDKTLYRIYGQYPSGTGEGLYVYRAGLADHYSQNAIFISIVLMALVSIFMYRLIGREKKKEKLLIAMILITLVAFLMAGKRGVLVFSFLAFFCVYFICNPDKFSFKVIKTVAVFALAAAALYIAAMSIPAVEMTFERFSELGEDNSSEERMAMLKLAISLFAGSPLFGIGTFGFRYQYASKLFGIYQVKEEFRYLNAHNVYVQVLCENGIIGLLLFLLAVIVNFVIAFRQFRLQRQQDSKNEVYMTALIFSLIFQVYFLAYCLTGNCLYDIVFSFYCIAAAIPYAVKRSKAREEIDYEKSGNHDISVG